MKVILALPNGKDLEYEDVDDISYYDPAPGVNLPKPAAGKKSIAINASIVAGVVIEE